MPEAEFEQLRDAVSHRYHLEGMLGRGGMGAVYRARHLSLDSPVAIKVLPIPASIGADELARFRREAMLAARLPNPHIVPVFEFEIREDIAYLVMPLVDGLSLADRLAQDGPLDLREARALAEEIGGALAFAHERDIIHRDVKPANILWEPANHRWLITDFGIARPVRQEGNGITTVGAVLGTPAYMAPEQAMGAELDGRADLYALAATLCEALTGKRLDLMATPAEGAAALRAARPDLSDRWVGVLTAPLALEPDARPPSVRAWLAQFPAAERRPGRGFVVAAVGITIVAALAGVWRLAFMPHAPRAPARDIIAVLPFDDATRLERGRGLAAAFENELRWVPNLDVVPAAAVAGVLGNLDLSAAGGRDSGTARVLARFHTTGILAGSIEGNDADGLAVSVQLQRLDGSITTASLRRGPPDSLAAMVTGTVVELFGPTGGDTLYRPAPPGGGLEAMVALRAGDSLFRAAAYDAAIERFDHVLALDSTYALAAFKRMLAEVMRSQPTRASRAVRTALDPIRRYRHNLDPLSRELLQAYEVLVTEGDVEDAHRRVKELTERYPLAVDAWFVRGYLEFYFGPLFRTDPKLARRALEQARELDPGFAAVHGMLGWIALEEIPPNNDVARTELGAYLALDSKSTWAELARLVDSLRLRGNRAALAALQRVDDRPAATLEMFALAGSSLALNHAERLLVTNAVRALRDRATTAEERATAFRLQLGNALGAGRAATVDTLLREGRRRNVPREELDHATVLLAVTGLGDSAMADAEITDAAGRLAADTSDPNGPWLAARWLRGRDASRARQAREVLRRMGVGAAGGEAILARSLLGDLEALDLLDAADTAGAFRRWSEATKRFQFEEVPFGPVASLWPLRLKWAQSAAARGDHNEVLDATLTFEQSPGFMDQAGRPIALALRADALDAIGSRLDARNLRQRYVDVLRDASGRWRALRDTLLARSGGS